MPKKNPVAAASAAERKAVNMIADALDINPKHTRYPSEDLSRHVDFIDEKSKKRAMQWYRRGLKRGFISACDAVIDGDLEFEDGILYSPEKITISICVKFRRGEFERKKFRFSSKELGFK